MTGIELGGAVCGVGKFWAAQKDAIAGGGIII